MRSEIDECIHIDARSMHRWQHRRICISRPQVQRERSHQPLDDRPQPRNRWSGDVVPLKVLGWVARNDQDIVGAQEPEFLRVAPHLIARTALCDLYAALPAPLGRLPACALPNDLPLTIDLPEAPQGHLRGVITDVSGKPIDHGPEPWCAGVGVSSWHKSWVLLSPTSPGETIWAVGPDGAPAARASPLGPTAQMVSKGGRWRMTNVTEPRRRTARSAAAGNSLIGRTTTFDRARTPRAR